MIYIETNSTDVFYNFAAEYYFAAIKPIDETVFLFWRTTPSLIIGKYQNTLEEIDNDYAIKHNITVARRMSGGGTMYIDMGGWQFTFIEKDKNGEIHFAEYLQPVIDALKELNIKAEFNGRNDLLIDGRKISGNSQYKLGDRTVHHGTLLFDNDIEQMVRATTVDEYKITSKSIKSVRERVTSIREHLEHDIDADEFKRLMVEHIMDGKSYKTYTISDEEKVILEKIADERFRPWEVVYGKNPKFDITNKKHFKGGTVEAKLNVNRGMITDCALYGDFFGLERVNELQEALVGCPYRKDDVIDVIKQHGLENMIHDVSAEELAELIVV